MSASDSSYFRFEILNVCYHPASETFTETRGKSLSVKGCKMPAPSR